MPIRSLSTRLLASVSVVLVLFFGLTIFALDLVFRDLSERTVHNRLETQVMALIAATDETEKGKLEPGQQLAEARFSRPGSGLYGEIRRTDGSLTWRSISTTGTNLSFPIGLKPGERRFGTLQLEDGTDVLALSLGLAWEFDNGRKRNLVFSVAETLEPYYAQLNRFRVQLFGWFGVLLVLLLAALAVLFRQVLKPLRRIEREIEEIEAGSLPELGEGYPRELAGVTSNLNTLLRNERERLTRYRNTLGNLAHSLKTPLAVMRNLLVSAELKNVTAAREFDEQVSRMDDIVGYQLKRAAAAASAGTGLGTAPVDVAEVFQQLRGALLKVHANRDLECRLDVTSGTRYLGDRGDLMEVSGNLLDNAFKWCRNIIQVTVRPLITPNTRREGLLLIIEDDGPGIAADATIHVLERGARLDERVTGQGIGLSVVKEIAEANGGSVTIDKSELGGARIEVKLPAP
jgi:two-component system sensor histidine kinase PhoQ